MNEEQLRQLWETKWVESYPREMLALGEFISQQSPMNTILEIGVMHCGTMRFWEKFVPEKTGLVIGVDHTARELILELSGDSTEPITRPPTHDFLNHCPSNWIDATKCTLNPYDPDNRPCEVHLVIGDSNSQEVHDEIEELLEGKRVDFMCHDGGHFGDVPLNDFHNIVLPFLRPGGWFALADRNCDGVDKLWDYINTLGGEKIEFIKPKQAGISMWKKP